MRALVWRYVTARAYDLQAEYPKNLSYYCCVSTTMQFIHYLSFTLFTVMGMSSLTHCFTPLPLPLSPATRPLPLVVSPSSPSPPPLRVLRPSTRLKAYDWEDMSIEEDGDYGFYIVQCIVSRNINNKS